jgi:Dolichyl-phosphate-mannose-protein mannosyltransferase
MSRKELALAAAAVAGWYALAWFVAHPLANAPVADSWIYSRAVRALLDTGGFHFVGFTQAMPVAQVIYGAGWAWLFGHGAVSLDLSVAILGALDGILFYVLARRCGASIEGSAIATALLIANPCYLLLSFSFMTEIPFLTPTIAACCAFAYADGEHETRWLCVAAALAVVAFMVRPFGVAALVGFAGAILLYDLQPTRLDRRWLRKAVPKLAPFAAGFTACAIGWVWFTMTNPEPWMLHYSEHRIEYILDVSPATYARAGVAGPLLYLGLVLSPVALMYGLSERRRRRALVLGAALMATAFALVWADPGLPSIPEMSCFGGWHNVLLLHGLPNRFVWTPAAQKLAIAIASFGAAGLLVAAADVRERLNRAASAVLIAALCYWAGTIPLWFFNDRYYLVLVPAGCLLLALAPMPRARVLRAGALAMLALLAYVSITGVYDYQRGLAALVEARDTLERRGVPRDAIDAGYSLNGEDLYRYIDKGADSYRRESGIPMITSARLEEYTMAATPIPGTEIIGRVTWPGPCGFGTREIYLLRKLTHARGTERLLRKSARGRS